MISNRRYRRKKTNDALLALKAFSDAVEKIEQDILNKNDKPYYDKHVAETHRERDLELQ